MTTKVIKMAYQVTHAPHRFTVDDYYRMADVGVLTRDVRVELLDGQVVEMSPSGSRHAGYCRIVTSQFDAALAGRGITSVQWPVRLDEWNEPEPDLAILVPRGDHYSGAHPGPGDVLLIVEMGDSSFRADRLFKLPLYARFHIPEVWLFDLVRNCLEVHRRPDSGRYTEIDTLGPDDRAVPAAFADIRIDLSFLK